MGQRVESDSGGAVCLTWGRIWFDVMEAYEEGEG